MGFYHHIAENHPHLIDAHIVTLNVEKNLLCMDFIAGETLRVLLLHGRKHPEARQWALCIMAILGGGLRQVYDLTCTPGAGRPYSISRRQ